MKNLRLVIIVLALALAIGIVWFFFLREKPIKTTEEAVEALSQTLPVTVETNPVKKVPSLNPVGKVNPFKISNPFE